MNELERMLSDIKMEVELTQDLIGKKVGARLVIPVGFPHHYQQLKVLEKKPDNEIEAHNILSVSFVPLTGEHGVDTAYRDTTNPKI